MNGHQRYSGSLRRALVAFCLLSLMTFLFALGVLVLEVQKLRKMSLPSEVLISRMDTFHDGASSSLISLEERADNLSLEIFKIADDINNRFAPASGGEN